MRLADGNCRRRARGSAMVYGLCSITVLCGLSTLAVDWGRVQLVHSQLQQAADAAALYAAAALPQGVTAVQKRASDGVADNPVEGAAIDFRTAEDLEFGIWSQSTHTFNVVSGNDRDGATALRLTTRRAAARGTATPLTFGSVIGKPNIDVAAHAIVTRGRPVAANVAANGCPWLAGMPAGSSVAGTGGNTTPSVAGTNSPVQITGMTLTPGQSLVFRDVAGRTAYSGSDQYGPDGNTSWIVAQDPANGINTTKAPLNSLVAIFLDDRTPSSYAMSPVADFTSNGSRNFDTLSPALKQVFFVGDGVDDAGKLQQFIVPPGATRLYIGIMDEKGWWWDNTGSLSTTMMDDHLTLVQ